MGLLEQIATEAQRLAKETETPIFLERDKRGKYQTLTIRVISGKKADKAKLIREVKK